MRNALRLYFRYVGFSLRGQMEYRADTILNVIGQVLITGIEFLAIWSLFDRFGSLRGWSLPQVALLYGMANVSMALATGVSRGFSVFDTMVKSGGFDRLLLRPRSTGLQVLAQELRIARLGRMLQGMVVLIWAVGALDVEWGAANATLLVAAVIGGACLFAGIFVLQATMAFWTTESLEIVNTVTYGGLETAQYPIAIYATWFRRFFTFVIPLACMNYYPSVAITGGPDPLGTPAWLSWLSPLAGFLFLLVSLQIWRIGVRHYRSTGS